MKIFIPEGSPINIRNFLRRLGYNSIINTKNDRLSFIKRLTSLEFPRFHIYVEKDLSGKNYLHLHLDQKKPSYDAGHAHMGEYGSDIVMAEAKKIAQALYQNIPLAREQKNEIPKKSFFKKFFNL